MSTHASNKPVDLSGTHDLSTVALVLAVLSVPGSLFTWDVLPGGGFLWGAPLAVAAVALGLRSRGVSKGKSTAAIVIAGAVLLMMVVWTAVAIISEA